MADQPTVAVCIPTYNQSRYLIESVESACRQTYPGVEVWVSDDASTDDTPAVLAELARRFPQLRHHRQPVNLNIAANNNWLLAQPQTDYLVRLDSDDLMEPAYVETLVALMEANPRAGYAHSAIRVIDESGRPLLVSRVARRSGFRSADKALRDAVAGYRVAANIVMFRGSAVRELGFYRGAPDFVEDYDLSIRMADAGYGNVYCDRVLARYRVWTDPKRVRSKRKGLQLRGLARLFEESLRPAFRRRGWNESILARERLRFAEVHAAGCYEPQYDARERAELKDLLFALAGCRPLRLRLRLAALDLGLRPVFDFERAGLDKLKRTAKTLIHRVRSLRTA